jgi:hypothetical protein
MSVSSDEGEEEEAWENEEQRAGEEAEEPCVSRLLRRLEYLSRMLYKCGSSSSEGSSFEVRRCWSRDGEGEEVGKDCDSSSQNDTDMLII